MTSATPDAISELLASARGHRPKSLACGEAEDALNVALALTVELAVANDRIDRLERMVADLRGEPVSTLRDVAYEGDAAAERRDAMEALLMRTMRIFLDPRRQSADHNGNG